LRQSPSAWQSYDVHPAPATPISPVFKLADAAFSLPTKAFQTTLSACLATAAGFHATPKGFCLKQQPYKAAPSTALVASLTDIVMSSTFYVVL
jgi:hypothetical protein